jgi:uncharacterized membrane protein
MGQNVRRDKTSRGTKRPETYSLSFVFLTSCSYGLNFLKVVCVAFFCLLLHSYNFSTDLTCCFGLLLLCWCCYLLNWIACAMRLKFVCVNVVATVVLLMLCCWCCVVAVVLLMLLCCCCVASLCSLAQCRPGLATARIWPAKYNNST